MTATKRGQLLIDTLAGREVGGVSITAMRNLCRDLGKSRPPRYIRAHHDVRRGGWRVTLVGVPVEAYRKS